MKKIINNSEQPEISVNHDMIEAVLSDVDTGCRQRRLKLRLTVNN